MSTIYSIVGDIKTLSALIDDLTDEELKEIEDSKVADAGHLIDERNYETKTGERWKDTEYLDYLNV